MKTRNKFLRSALIIFVFGTTIAFAGKAKPPMPPTLSYATNPVEILRNYPLGVITNQDAFAHHGGPVRKLTLPNGLQGWLYKTGEKVGVPGIYMLQFSNEGVVIDVLHKDHRYKIGHSALQYQILQEMEAEPRTLGPGPRQ